MLIIKYLPTVLDWSLKLGKTVKLSQFIIKERNLNRWGEKVPRMVQGIEKKI